MLRRLWARWRVIALKIGNVQSRVLLLLFYFLILAPFALLVKLFSDPLRCKLQDHSHWIPKAKSSRSVSESARRQF